MDTQLNFIELPQDVQTRVLGKLDFKDLLAVGSTCTLLKSLSNSEFLWLNLCQRWASEVSISEWLEREGRPKKLFKLLHSLSKLVGVWGAQELSPRGGLLYVTWKDGGAIACRILPIWMTQGLGFRKLFKVSEECDGTWHVSLLSGLGSSRRDFMPGSLVWEEVGKEFHLEYLNSSETTKTKENGAPTPTKDIRSTPQSRTNGDHRFSAQNATTQTSHATADSQHQHRNIEINHRFPVTNQPEPNFTSSNGRSRSNTHLDSTQDGHSHNHNELSLNSATTHANQGWSRRPFSPLTTTGSPRLNENLFLPQPNSISHSSGSNGSSVVSHLTDNSQRRSRALNYLRRLVPPSNTNGKHAHSSEPSSVPSSRLNLHTGPQPNPLVNMENGANGHSTPHADADAASDFNNFDSTPKLGVVRDPNVVNKNYAGRDKTGQGTFSSRDHLEQENAEKNGFGKMHVDEDSEKENSFSIDNISNETDKGKEKVNGENEGEGALNASNASDRPTNELDLLSFKSSIQEVNDSLRPTSSPPNIIFFPSSSLPPLFTPTSSLYPSAFPFPPSSSSSSPSHSPPSPQLREMESLLPPSPPRSLSPPSPASSQKVPASKYRKIEVQEESKGKELAGLWIGNYGPHGLEVLNVSYDFTKREIIATKILGDPNVPCGEVTFKAYLDSETNENLPNFDERWMMSMDDDEIRENNNHEFVKSYDGHGRIAEYNFQHPKWVLGQLLVDKFGKMAFIWKDVNFMIRFHRISLPSVVKKILSSDSEKDDDDDDFDEDDN